MSEMLDAALSCAEMGWAVFPCHTPDISGTCSCHKFDCGNNGKHPRTEHGKDDATTDVAKITRWWGMWPDANIGVATGSISGCVVIDVDPRHGGAETLKILLGKHGQLFEKVWTSTGGGGWHLYFAHPNFPVKSVAHGLGQGVDVKGEGGYVIAPPSLHASGKRYSWGDDCLVPPQMPAWMINLLQQPTQPQSFILDGEQIPDGARNKTLTSMAGSMRRRGMTPESIYAALSVENEQRCSPPLPDMDVRKIAHSVGQYAPDDPSYIFPQKTLQDGERPEGIHFVSEMRDAIYELYRKGMRGGVSTGIAALDRNYTVPVGQWTVITGAPSHGKTVVLDTILHNLADLHNWKVAVTSIENQPLERHAAQLIAIHMGQPFGEGEIPRMDEQTMEAGIEWLDKHFVFVLPEEGDCTVAGILERVHWLDESNFAVQGVVIDPWNELEHRRPAGMNETEYISQSLTRMRRFARDKKKHLWLVAHPTKLQKDIKTGNYPVPTLYDISGSAHFRNKADFGLSVWRDVLNDKSPTEVHVQKVRFRECGRIGKVELYFNVVSNGFSDSPPTYRNYLVDAEAEERALEKM